MFPDFREYLLAGNHSPTLSYAKQIDWTGCQSCSRHNIVAQYEIPQKNTEKQCYSMLGKKFVWQGREGIT